MTEDIPILHETDVAVVGGGLAGVATAVAAAREGATTVLIEQTEALAQDAFALPERLDGFTCIDERPLGGWLLERLTSLLGDRAEIVDGRLFVSPADLAGACEAVCRESGVTILYAAPVAGVALNGNVVEAVTVVHSGRPVQIAAHCFVDTTSAAIIASRAGAPYEDAATSGVEQPLVVALRCLNVNADKYADGGSQAIGKLEKRKSSADPLAGTSFEVIIPAAGARVEAWVYLSASPAPKLTDPTSRSNALRNARVLSCAAADALIENVPGFAGAQFPDASPRIALRDVRRISAPLRLTEEHMREDATWPDALGMVAARREEADDETDPWCPPAAIPYRCLLCEQIDSLLVAGSCIATVCPSPRALRTGLAALVTGQIAGVAAALAARRHLSPRNLSIKQIAGRLTEQGAVLP